MSEQKNFDVVVVGGGLGGLTTAARASQLGLKVAVLERGSDERYVCNSRYSGGVMHISMHNVKDPAESLVKVIDQATLGYADKALAHALAHNGARAVDWLQQEGAKYIRVGQIVWQQFVLAPPRPITPGLDWKGRGPDVTLRLLEANIVKRGGVVFRGTAATGLMEANGRCTGVEAESQGSKAQFGARAVVLADGGFQANLDLIGKHITPQAAKVKQRGAATGIGDGIRMAKALGGEITALEGFYGHMLSRDSFTNDNVWPYPQLDELGTVGVVVDGNGERFTDEGLGGVYVANKIAGLSDPMSTWAVFDEAIWEGPGRTARIPANPNLVKAGGTVHKAPTLAALAQIMGVPPERLELTIGNYNRALGAGQLSDLKPQRSTTRIAAEPVAKAPFYAVPLCAGITYTFGGVAIDPDARVRRAGGGMVEGLYAVGATSGGLEGGPQIGYVGGLIKAASFGLLAAEHIAKSSR